jgi:hypothetical protein
LPISAASIDLLRFKLRAIPCLPEPVERYISDGRCETGRGDGGSTRPVFIAESFQRDQRSA